MKALNEKEQNEMGASRIRSRNSHAGTESHQDAYPLMIAFSVYLEPLQKALETPSHL